MYWITEASRRIAERESFSAIDETCPTLDEQEEKLNNAVATAIQTIKDQATYPFRKALIDAIAEKNEAEKEVAELKEQAEKDKARIQELEHDAQGYERKIELLEQKLDSFE